MKIVEYKFSRLCFKADIIEPLNVDDIFIVHTPEGSFQMSKADFYEVFSNVVNTKSYKERGIYHYPKTPNKALQYLK